MEREVERWITVNGKHIPIYADEPDDDKRKEKQIADNEREAAEKNSGEAEFGEPGTYTLYRVGKVDFGKKNYRISFAQDKDYADTYTGSHEGMQVEKYSVDIKKPLVINLKADRVKDWKGNEGWRQDEQAGTYEAYNKLFGTKYDYKTDPGVYDKGSFFDYAKYGSPKARKMLRQRDQEIMDEAVKQGYDAVIYKFDRPGTVNNSGFASDPYNKNEVLIPSEYKKRIRKGN